MAMPITPGTHVPAYATKPADGACYLIKKAYAREELVAELGSVLLGDQLEIGSALENHAAYLGHWVELLKENPQGLYQVLGEARRAVELVLLQTAD